MIPILPMTKSFPVEFTTTLSAEGLDFFATIRRVEHPSPSRVPCNKGVNSQRANMSNQTTANDSSRREFLSQSALAIGALAATAATSSRADDAAPAAERSLAHPKRNWKKGFYGGWGSKNATILENFQI